jgi:hypothetical protein
MVIDFPDGLWISENVNRVNRMYFPITVYYYHRTNPRPLVPRPRPRCEPR